MGDKNSKQDKNGKAKTKKSTAFDIDNPVLPPAIAEKALTSGGYPYDEELKKKVFKEDLLRAAARAAQAADAHRDARASASSPSSRGATPPARAAASATSSSASIRGTPAPWRCRSRPRPSAASGISSATCAHLPTAGDMTLFDRSWYNRAGVERVMNFCTPVQTDMFLRDAPDFEALLVRDGIRLFKFYLVIGREMQLERFHERRHDPFKRWKITDVDLAAIDKWDDYSRAQSEIFKRTSTEAIAVDRGARQRSAARPSRGDPLGAFPFRLSPTRTRAPSARRIPRSSAPARNISRRSDVSHICKGIEASSSSATQVDGDDAL